MADHKLSSRTFLWVLLISVALTNACTQGTVSPTSSATIQFTSQPTIVLTSTHLVTTPSPTDQTGAQPTLPGHYPSQTSLASPSQSKSTEAVTQSPTPDSRLSPYYWRNWPVIPELSSRALSVFQYGQELGNDIHSFSRIGDCQSVPAIFLGIYDTDRYWLSSGDEYLQMTIDQFSGSFQRTNLTAKDGFGVASVFAPLMADPKLCQSNESPLECEYRLHKPIIAFIAMGTNWKPKSELTFDRYLRQIIDFSLEHGIIPVLVTKADNIEQDNLLNVTIARVAYDYDMPLYNAWAAVQYLPNHGLEEDNIYLTTDAWDTRNYAGLKVLDSIWTTLKTSLAASTP